MAVLFIYKNGSKLTDMFKPVFINFSEEFEEIHFGAIDLEKNEWIGKNLGIKDEEYEK